MKKQKLSLIAIVFLISFLFIFTACNESLEENDDECQCTPGAECIDCECEECDDTGNDCICLDDECIDCECEECDDTGNDCICLDDECIDCECEECDDTGNDCICLDDECVDCECEECDNTGNKCLICGELDCNGDCEDDLPYLMVFEGELTQDAWVHDILEVIKTRGEKVILDLSKATPSTEKSVLFYHEFPDPYIVFNPHSEYPNGKEFIAELILPDAATMIIIADSPAASAFNFFTSLRKISGAGIKFISAYAFYGNTTLEEAYFPEAVSVLHKHAFKDCTSLKNVYIPKINYITAEAFAGCTSLTEVNFPEVTVMEPRVFVDCTNLKTVNLPKLGILDPTTFEGCTSLESVSFEIIETIFENTFMNLTNLKTVDSPNVKVIGNEAFEGCTSLVEVSFPSATTIWGRTFKNCTNLKIARFHANPDPASGHPVRLSGSWPYHTEESIFFGEDVFKGCTNLEILDVRNAWNVYFSEGALANIGTHLDIYLYDDGGKSEGGKSFGHPQINASFGGTFIGEKGGGSFEGITLKTITLYLNFDGGMVFNDVNYDEPGGNNWGYTGIKVFIEDAYPWNIGDEHTPKVNIEIIP